MERPPQDGGIELTRPRPQREGQYHVSAGQCAVVVVTGTGRAVAEDEAVVELVGCDDFLELVLGVEPTRLVNGHGGRSRPIPPVRCL